MILRALSFGLAGALMVGLLKLVDSNHTEPPRVIVGDIAATAFWLTVIAAAAIAVARFLRRRKAGS